MLVLLGALNLRSIWSGVSAAKRSAAFEHPHALAQHRHVMRPLIVGVVHGLAGSAAVALLVLGTIRDSLRAVFYLLVFAVGSIAGMLLITTVLALPIAAAARRFNRFHRLLVLATGMATVALGVTILCELGSGNGVFSQHPQWLPR